MNRIKWTSIALVGGPFALTWMISYQLWWLNIVLPCGFGSTCNSFFGIPANTGLYLIPTIFGAVVSAILYFVTRKSPNMSFEMPMKKFVISILPIIASAAVLIGAGSFIVYSASINAGCTFLFSNCASAVDSNALTQGFVFIGLGYAELGLSAISSRKMSNLLGQAGRKYISVLVPLVIGFSALIVLGAYTQFTSYSTVGCITNIANQQLLCATNIDPFGLTLGSVLLILGALELVISVMMVIRSEISEKMPQRVQLASH